MACLNTSAASRSMEWWCRVCIQGNDSSPLPCTGIWCSGIFTSVSLRMLGKLVFVFKPFTFSVVEKTKNLTKHTGIFADPEVWPSTHEQSYGCSPWCSCIYTRYAVSILILLWGVLKTWAYLTLPSVEQKSVLLCMLFPRSFDGTVFASEPSQAFLLTTLIREEFKLPVMYFVSFRHQIGSLSLYHSMSGETVYPSNKTARQLQPCAVIVA